MMENSLNIVELIENNPITRLSATYQSKLLTKIQDGFTELEQQMFVSSFYCYLNYHKTNDFVIDLDNVWKWLGFSQKVNAKRVLEKILLLIRIINHCSAKLQSKRLTPEAVIIKKHFC